MKTANQIATENIKTPEQIAADRLAEVGYADWYRPYLEQVREDIAAAIEEDRAQRIEGLSNRAALENIVVGFTCPECENEETVGLDALVIIGTPICSVCDTETEPDTTADVLPA